MKAIQTKVLKPTDTKGLRIKAYDLDGNSVIISWEHGLNDFSNHVTAVKSLIHKMGWTFEPYGGVTKEGYAFVDVSTLVETVKQDAKK